MEKKMNEPYLSSVKNAMKILRLYKERQNELSVTEIANMIDMPKSTTHWYIKLLEKEGFLSKNPRTKRYRLGLALLTLGGVVFSHKDLYKEALPIVQNLVNQLDETAQICLLENDDVVYLFRTECSNPVRLLTQIGRRNPVHCTSEGLTILAFQDEKAIGSVLRNELHGYTPYTITDPVHLKTELNNIKEKKYAISKDQYYQGFVGIATPIYDFKETVVSSLSMIGPTSRITEDKYPIFIEKISKAAGEISEMLGYYK